MSIKMLDLGYYNRLSIALGSAVLALVALAQWLGWLLLGDLELILLLAIAFIVPLAVPLIVRPAGQGLLPSLSRLAILIQPLVTFIGGVSLLLARGPLSAVAASVWLLYTALLALAGVFLVLQSGRRLADVCLAMALIYAPIGGAWLVLNRAGIQPLGFGQTTVLLTAVHFHYITFVGLVITGLTIRAIQKRRRAVQRTFYSIVCICMIADPLLVAAGITLTHLTGVYALESTAAVLLAVCLIIIALISLRVVVPVVSSPAAKVLLAVASSAVVFTMLLAAAYALGAATHVWTITIPQMIATHGWVNALIFGVCGLLGWRLACEQRVV
jgi:hypothetical protein